MPADGVLLGLHDSTLDRATRGPAPACSGPVIERTLNQLASCEAGSWFNEAHPALADNAYAALGIPALREVLERFGRTTRYYVETKNPEERLGMENALLAEIEIAGLLPEDVCDWTVLVQSFSESSLGAIQPGQGSLMGRARHVAGFRNTAHLRYAELARQRAEQERGGVDPTPTRHWGLPRRAAVHCGGQS